MNNNTQSLTPNLVEKLNINTILMSPPCQPFSRNGNFLDLKDPRTEAFLHVIELIKALKNVRYIMMENVKGFEKSEAHDLFVKSLTDSGYDYKEYILSPNTTIGTPNSRNRYYCLATRSERSTIQPAEQKIENDLGKPPIKPNEIANYIESLNEDERELLMIPDTVLLQRYKVLDICTPTSTNSMCFTKAYSRFFEGTGSVLTEYSESDVRRVFAELKKTERDEERLKLLKSLELRFFSPREIARLMNFRDGFMFPPCISQRQCFRLLGNSINVAIVCELIKIMCLT
jgi:tRNA (cytosine38-C5)-methyltransferase